LNEQLALSLADLGKEPPGCTATGSSVIVVSVLEEVREELRPISRAEYAKMAELGLFEGERVELLYGAIVTMSPTGAPHDGVIQRLTRLLILKLDPRAAIRVQSSFIASESSQPQPDLAVCAPHDYLDEHPAEAWLVIEVADSSRRRDRGLKTRLYAEVGIPEYWVVDLQSRLIEVYTDIIGGKYSRVTPYRKGAEIALVHFPDVSLAVNEVLP
jgi:Uma2 family endonuclease